MDRMMANIAEVRDLRARFEREAHTVDELMRTVGTQLRTVQWESSAASRFRNQWDTQFEPGLRGLKQALEDAERDLRQRIAKLEEAER